jgi:prevent-host-death family protein
VSDVSIAQAKAHFAQLVQQAEAGEAVRITRRGKPVAMLVSPQRFEQSKAPAEHWVAFSRAWRDTMQAQGHAFLNDAELQGLRAPASGRPDLDLG